MKTQAINKMSVTAPISGKIIPITEVPDSVFSEKVLGDGIAIIPSDGKIYSPVNGVVSSVAETLHAYGFTSDDGLDVLVHFGLETVNLKGEGFKSYVKDGDRVKVSSRRGSIETTANVSGKTNPGECWMPFHFLDGGANWLTSDALDSISSTPEYKVCAVKIENTK